MRPWASFAGRATDADDVMAQKGAAFVVAGSCCVAGLIWSGVYLAVFGWGLTAALPAAFVVVVGGAMVVAHVRRDHRIAVYVQIVCIIGITAAIQWSIGGLSESGLVILWAFVGPMTALVFLSLREATAWFVVYLAVVVASVALEDSLVDGGVVVSDGTQLAFVAMNLVGASVVVFAFSAYFVTQATSERERADRLLRNVLPERVARRLKRDGGTMAERFDSASVLFADVVGSTPLFAGMDPGEAVDWLNEVFSAFDELVGRHGVEKIRTVGDSYMVAAGAPAPRDDHAEAICRLALDMVEAIERVPPRRGRQLQFRIGVSSGPMVGGVIGTERFHYDVWGDTVNIASRMESHGEPGRVQVTQATVDLLGPGFGVEERGMTEVKGRGSMPTWFLVSAPDAPVS